MSDNPRSVKLSDVLEAVKSMPRYYFAYDPAHPDWPMLVPDDSGRWLLRDEVLALLGESDAKPTEVVEP